MTISDYEYLLTIAEERNIRRAAERCAITPSALTQKIKVIEAEVGAELFLRSNAGCVPTESGQIFLQSAKEILTIRRATEQQIRDNENMHAGTLKIGIPPDRGADLFVYVFPRFHAQYPQVNIRLVENNTMRLQQMVADGELDLAIVGTKDSQRIHNRYIDIRREEVLAVMPRSLVNQGIVDVADPDLDLRQLRDQPFAMINKESTLRQWQDTIFEEYGIQPVASFEISRASAIIKLVALGLCCSIISDYYYHPEISELYYSRISKPSIWHISATYNTKGYLSEAARCFIALAKEYLDTVPVLPY